MTEDGLLEILREPKNAIIKQYVKLFDLDNIELEFTEGALREIAKEAVRRKTGARGLRAVIEKVMEDTMFESPSNNYLSKVTITKETVLDSAPPECVLLAPEPEVEPEPEPEPEPKVTLEVAPEPEALMSGSA